jgi:hypothetical protein
MILLTKLLLAHLIGDFVLQPSAWVRSKVELKIRSLYFYLHCLVHVVLVLVFLWDLGYWSLAVLIGVIHGGIDLLKLYFQQQKHTGHNF